MMEMFQIYRFLMIVHYILRCIIINKDLPQLVDVDHYIITVDYIAKSIDIETKKLEDALIRCFFNIILKIYFVFKTEVCVNIFVDVNDKLWFFCSIFCFFT